MAMPAITFDDKITLDLGSHVIELISLGKTHTPLRNKSTASCRPGRSPRRAKDCLRRSRVILVSVRALLHGHLALCLADVPRPR